MKVRKPISSNRGRVLVGLFMMLTAGAMPLAAETSSGPLHAGFRGAHNALLMAAFANPDIVVSPHNWLLDRAAIASPATFWFFVRIALASIIQTIAAAAVVKDQGMPKGVRPWRIERASVDHWSHNLNHMNNEQQNKGQAQNIRAS